MKEEASISILFAVVFIKFVTLRFLLCILDIGGWDVYESILSLSLVSSFLVSFCFFLPFWILGFHPVWQTFDLCAFEKLRPKSFKYLCVGFTHFNFLSVILCGQCHVEHFAWCPKQKNIFFKLVKLKCWY